MFCIHNKKNKTPLYQTQPEKHVKISIKGIIRTQMHKPGAEEENLLCLEFISNVEGYSNQRFSAEVCILCAQRL